MDEQQAPEEQLPGAEEQLAAMDRWRHSIQIASGWANVAMEEGWPEPYARMLAFEQWRYNLRLDLVIREQQTAFLRTSAQ